ncbi:MAG: hypothetical protein PWR10_2098 [Halanaerobiales bacterium]|nr:hypothetical protein [Halanaerobiales bacterium]
MAARTIYEFRDRLAAYLKENDEVLMNLFDNLVSNFIEEAGISTKIQRMDSTMIKANIKHLSRIQLLHKITVNFIGLLSPHQQKKIHKNTMSIFEPQNFKEFSFSKNRNIIFDCDVAAVYAVESLIILISLYLPILLILLFNMIYLYLNASGT